jgi:methionyl-tRNA formyltransferase
LAPDLIVVIAYGQILPKSVLDIPKYGCINVHASLLPKYRGAAPINKAIMEGETETGITTIMMDPGLDTGDMLVKKHLSIGPSETAGELHDRMAQLARLAMEETVRLLCAGKLTSHPQDDSESSYAQLLKKEDGLIDWARPAKEIHNHVRGLDPWPGAYTLFQGQVLKVFRTQPESKFSGAPGTILAISKEALYIACGKDSLEIKELQLAGRKRLPVAEFLRGSPIETGDQFS